MLDLAGRLAEFQTPLAAFVLTTLLIEMTPGPNMAYLAVLGASRGRLAGFAAVLGVALGLALLGLTVGFGAGSLILDHPVAYESLRWAGAAYLCWLAYDCWQDSRRPIQPDSASRSLLVQFRRGLVSNLLNPKAALFFIAVVPEFVRGPAPSPRELALLICLYVGIATAVHALIVLLAGTLQAFLSAPARRRLAGNLFATMLLLIAVWLFASSGS